MYRAKPKIQPPLYSDLPPTGPEIEKAKSLMQGGSGSRSGMSPTAALAGLTGMARLLRGAVRAGTPAPRRGI